MMLRSLRSQPSLRIWLALSCLALMGASQGTAPVDCTRQRQNLPAFQTLAKSFQYDAKLPAELNVLSSTQANGLSVESVEFAGVKGGRCSAAILAPSNRGKFPAVVWLGSGDKDWEPYATEFSKEGAVSFLLDHCDKGSLYVAKELYNDDIQDVINIRRAIDILSDRPDVDPGRIAFVGHSGGGMLGADAVAVDKRFKAAVFESGLQGFTYHVCTSPHPFAIDIREHLDGGLKEYVSTLAPLDAILYIGHAAPTVLLFQSGTADMGVSESDARALFDAASEPKRLLWYDTGHKMAIPAVSMDRTAFLKEQLGMH